MLVALCVGISQAALADDPTWRWNGVARIVAFGDVHGAQRELVALLQQVGVIDAEQHWSGGATHLVSVGDLIDRGPGSKAVLDLLMRLETEAPRAGGKVPAKISLSSRGAARRAGFRASLPAPDRPAGCAG